jgi:hypothetical protein
MDRSREDVDEVLTSTLTTRELMINQKENIRAFEFAVQTTIKNLKGDGNKNAAE